MTNVLCTQYYRETQCYRETGRWLYGNSLYCLCSLPMLLKLFNIKIFLIGIDFHTNIYLNQNSYGDVKSRVKAKAIIF